MSKKIVGVFIVIFGIGYSILISRLVNLQIVNSTYYSGKVASQQLSNVTISAQRGTIYDSNMVPLAESAAVWDVAVSPAYIKNEKQKNNIADNLSKILQINRTTVYNEINNKSDYIVIAKKIEKPTADQITQFKKKYDIGCVTLVDDSKRYYPFGDFAAQLIGFTGSAGQGLDGIEAEYNSVLSGTPGKDVTEKTATGEDMPYDIGNDIPAKDGDNLVLTIDEVVQQDLEDNLKQALITNKVTNRVTGIVMNVNTGEILAMATAPGFDPNNPFVIADTTVQKQLSALSGNALKTATLQAEQTQWRNKAISEPYEPGSTFKIVTASAALQEGVVNENTMFNDPGFADIAGTIIHSWMGYGQGNISFLQGFEDSNDTVFIETGEKLGFMNFFKYYSGFGLTQKTEIDLPGEAGSIYYNQNQLGPVQLASEAFGQSDKITAIQLITAVAAASNGGYLVQPHVVKEETDVNGDVVKAFGTTVKRQVVSSETSKEIDTMLYDEVSIGTGKNAYVAGYRIGGKTGTSQKLDDPSDPNAVVSSMVGVAPTDDPQYAVLVVMDEPHAPNNFGGVIASPIVGNIMSEILPYLGVEPKYTAAELAKLDIKTPDLSGRTVSDVTTQLKAQGLKVNVIGNGQTVTTQVPLAGNPIPQNGTVIVYTGSAQIQNSVTVPSLSGMTPAQANSALVSAGLNPNFVGTGLTDAGEAAYDQDKTAGSKVAPGTVVSVKFRNNNIKVQ
jgi:stage V sporulation protein D (sporulation-specific penicillin-binding protein)